MASLLAIKYITWGRRCGSGPSARGWPAGRPYRHSLPINYIGVTISEVLRASFLDISSRALSVYFSLSDSLPFFVSSFISLKASVRQCPALRACFAACYAIQHHRFGSPLVPIRLYVVLRPWTKRCDFVFPEMETSPPQSNLTRVCKLYPNGFDNKR